MARAAPRAVEALSRAAELRARFEQLVELDPAQRSDRLRDWALEPSLQRELDALLQADAESLPHLAVPACEAAGPWREQPDLVASYVGAQVGSFRVRELIGQGGSSAVFRAEREAGGACQVVALKLLRTGLFSPESQRRFAREHAILAQLSHPNIARLIEGGISDAGVPYIAMEMVEGAPITVHCDAQALGLRERVQRVATLCRAVEAAHAALVVHRDLKPSNVYVDADGAVKVLDFGTAKLIAEDSAGYTRTEAIVLTPAYAAPEQFKSGAVTTAADVYALGVLLGELLTGQLLGIRTTARASAIVTGAGHECTPRGLPRGRLLGRALRGDLDAIIATALAEEPGRRYRSAGALADDLDRFLAGRPVQAHPPSRWYAVRKFAQRHRRGVAGTALLLLGLLVTLGVALWQADAARRAATLAAAEAARANAMRDVLFDAFTQATPGAPRAKEPTVTDLVERAIATATSDRTTEPRARIELLTRLAQVLGARGHHDRGAALLATTARQADATLASDDPLRHDLAVAQVSNLVERGLLAEARVAADRVLRELGALPSPTAVRAYGESTYIANRQRDFARAERDAREALRRAVLIGDVELVDLSRHALGSALLNADRGAEAAAIFEQTLQADRLRYGDDHVEVASEHDALSRAYRRAGDLDQAEQHARAAVAIGEKAMPRDHPSLATHMNALVSVLTQRRALDEGVFWLNEIIRIQRIADGDPDKLAANYGTLATYHAAMGDWSTALATSRLALAQIRLGGGEQSYLGFGIRIDFGYLLAMNGERAEGEAALARVLDDLRAAQPVDADRVALTHERLLRFALETGDFAAARRRFAAYEAAAAQVQGRPTWAGRAATLQADLLRAEGDLAGARAALDRAEAELASGVRSDAATPVNYALLRVLVAASDSEAKAARTLARERLAAMRFPPLYVQQIARQAKLL